MRWSSVSGMVPSLSLGWPARGPGGRKPPSGCESGVKTVCLILPLPRDLMRGSGSGDQGFCSSGRGVPGWSRPDAGWRNAQDSPVCYRLAGRAQRVSEDVHCRSADDRKPSLPVSSSMPVWETSGTRCSRPDSHGRSRAFGASFGPAHSRGTVESPPGNPGDVCGVTVQIAKRRTRRRRCLIHMRGWRVDMRHGYWASSPHER
jgi:hypothetical protein